MCLSTTFKNYHFKNFPFKWFNFNYNNYNCHMNVYRAWTLSHMRKFTLWPLYKYQHVSVIDNIYSNHPKQVYTRYFDITSQSYDKEEHESTSWNQLCDNQSWNNSHGKLFSFPVLNTNTVSDEIVAKKEHEWPINCALILYKKAANSIGQSPPFAEARDRTTGTLRGNEPLILIIAVVQ